MNTTQTTTARPACCAMLPANMQCNPCRKNNPNWQTKAQQAAIAKYRAAL